MGEMDEPMPSPAGFPVRKVLKCLLRFWWLPLLTLILGLGSAGVFVYFKAPTYFSKAAMVESVKLRLPEAGLFQEDSQTSAGTQTELLKSKALADAVVARLRAMSNGIAIPKGKDGEPLEVDIRVTGGGKSAVFGLQATSSKATYTQVFLDALMQVYLEYKRDTRRTLSGETLTSITTQLEHASREWRREEDTLIAFQRTNNLVILQEEGTIAGGYLARLRTQLSDLELQKRLLTGSLSVAGDTNSNPDWASVANPDSGPTAPGAERHNAYRELELLKMQRERLSENLRPKHPKIVKLDADIERAAGLLEIYQQQNREQLQASLRSIDVKMTNVQSSISEWEAKVITANTRIGEAERLRRSVERARKDCEDLELMVRNVGISRNIEMDTLSILEPASPPKRSYSQEVSLLALGLAGGLALGLALVVLIALRDDRFTSALEIGEKVGQIIVGQVPMVEAAKGAASNVVLQLDDPRHVYSESFRNLRSALLFMPGKTPSPKVLLVTSAVPNEGKSTVAVNLARALAFGGSHVLLVDADLRKGVLHKLIGLERGPGLAEALAGDRDSRTLVQSNCIPNLDFVGTGLIARHSGDLLLDARFDEMLKDWRAQYDYVLLDSSPVFATDDATTLAPKVDGTLFVVRNGFSRQGQVRQALEQLYLRNAQVLGVVFNQADHAESSYYYKYAEYYHPVPNGS